MTSTCLTPFKISTQRIVPRSILIYFVWLVYVSFSKLMYFLVIEFLSKRCHKLGSFYAVRSFCEVNEADMLLNIIDFSIIFLIVGICSMVQLPS